jgi:Family of unknown function (DUF6326)
VAYRPRSSLPANTLAWLAARLAHLTPPRRPGQGGTPPLPLEVRLDAVAAVLPDGLSYRRAGRMVGISKTEVGDSLDLLLGELAALGCCQPDGTLITTLGDLREQLAELAKVGERYAWMGWRPGCSGPPAGPTRRCATTPSGMPTPLAWPCRPSTATCCGATEAGRAAATRTKPQDAETLPSQSVVPQCDRLPASVRGKGATTMSTSNSRILEDERISVRLKIAARWVAMLLLFAYGDIFGFFNPGQIEEVMGGEISGIEITQVFLFGVSVYITIASVMVFLSLVLRPSVNRWTNIALPILYIVSIVVSAIGETSAYFLFLSVAESALLLLIIWYAWTWPRQESTTTH